MLQMTIIMVITKNLLVTIRRIPEVLFKIAKYNCLQEVALREYIFRRIAEGGGVFLTWLNYEDYNEALESFITMKA